MAKAMDLIFHFSMLFSLRGTFFPYCYKYNAFFMDLQKLFFNRCWFVLLYNGLNIVGNKVSSFQMIIDIAGVLGAIVLMWYVWAHQ